MDVTYVNRRLEKELNSEKEISRRYGHAAKPLMRRLFTLRAVANLELVPKLPPERCHELTGSRKGEFAVILTGNWRLVFKPDPAFHKPDGGIDLAAVTRIQILSIEDYH